MVDQQDGETTVTVQNLGPDALPEGDVLLSVAYSSLNYKDGLAITGKAKVLRSHPMVPGVDMAGTVLESDSPDFKAGDQVILTGFEHGEKYWGGFTKRNRVSSAGMIHLPPGPNPAPIDGCRHGRSHRHVIGDGPRGARPDPGGST
jgi:acrylyl-CoA reductase (NADPH)